MKNKTLICIAVSGRNVAALMLTCALLPHMIYLDRRTHTAKNYDKSPTKNGVQKTLWNSCFFFGRPVSNKGLKYLLDTGLISISQGLVWCF